MHYVLVIADHACDEGDETPVGAVLVNAGNLPMAGAEASNHRLHIGTK
jgi:tRNA(Arg) A34 adenosine deaminase TadA